MKPKLTLIGIVIIAVGGVILATLPAMIYIGAPLILIGTGLFVGLYSEDLFLDYVTQENGNYVYSARKRSYYHFLPFDMIFDIFGVSLKFIYKVDYYKIVSPSLELEHTNLDNYKITKAEYKQLLENQKQQYQNRTVPQEIVADICSPNIANAKIAKTRYIIWIVATLLALTMLTQPIPAAWAMAIVWSGLFGWLTVLRYADYKDEKFKNDVYDNYFKDNNNNK